MERASGRKRDRLSAICRAAAIMIAIAATCYWLSVLTHAYFSFLDGGQDLSVFAYNFWFNLHNAGLTHGLQYISFGNHLSPDALAILLLYSIFPYSITLVYLQTIVICLSSLLVYYIAERMLGDPLVALAISAAFLINPGILGVLTFDFHLEFMIVPTYLLTFYFYMKSDSKLFAISLLLLLGTIEVAPLVALSLGLGLLAYELSVANWKWENIAKEKRIMVAAIILFSIVAGMLYYGAMSYLQSSYSASYQGLPDILKINFGSQYGITTNVVSFLSSPVSFLSKNLSVYANPLGLYILALSVIVTLFGFGFFTLKRPLTTFLLILPWIIPALLWSGNIHYLYTGFQYYACTVGATIAAEIIGAMVVMRRDSKGKPTYNRTFVVASILLIAVMAMLASLFVSGKPITYLSPQTQYAGQLYSMMRLIPQNASVMTQYTIFPHLADRQQIEFTWSEINRYGYFVPQYIILSYSNSSIYSNFQYDALNYTVSNYNYQLYAQDGNARVYILDSQSG